MKLGSFYKISDDENWRKKFAIFWPFVVEMAPDFALQLSFPKIWNFCFWIQKFQCQTKLLAAIFFNFGDPWSCHGVLYGHKNGFKSKFI